MVKVVITSSFCLLNPPRDFLNVYKTEFCFYPWRINCYRNSLPPPAVNNWNTGQILLNSSLQGLHNRQFRTVIPKRREIKEGSILPASCCLKSVSRHRRRHRHRDEEPDSPVISLIIVRQPGFVRESTTGEEAS